MERLEDLNLKRGEIALLRLNDFSGVTIKTPNHIVVIDPTEINPEEFHRTDVILITHEHADHLDPSIIRIIQERTKCLVIADDMSMQYLRDVIPSEKLIQGNIGQEFKVKSINVHSLRTAWFVKGDIEQWNPLTYVITSEDGVQIFHSGDSPPFSEMSELGERFCIDIALCPIGGGNAAPRSGAQIPILMRSKVAIPYHAHQGFEEFCKILTKEASNIKCEILESGEIYQYHRPIRSLNIENQNCAQV